MTAANELIGETVHRVTRNSQRYCGGKLDRAQGRNDAKTMTRGGDVIELWPLPKVQSADKGRITGEERRTRLLQYICPYKLCCTRHNIILQEVLPKYTPHDNI